MKTKEQLINQLIKDNGFTKYLEIGSQAGYCFNQIDCEHKHGIDPDPVKDVEYQFRMTSNQFFEDFCHDTYDLIFIDGLHHSKQVAKDFINSLKVLNKGGIILFHDMMPTSEESQRVPRETKEWYGDVWKVGYYLLVNFNRFIDNDVEIKTHDFDCGMISIKVNDLKFFDSLDRICVNIEYYDYKEHFEYYKKTFYEGKIRI